MGVGGVGEVVGEGGVVTAFSIYKNILLRQHLKLDLLGFQTQPAFLHKYLFKLCTMNVSYVCLPVTCWSVQLQYKTMVSIKMRVRWRVSWSCLLLVSSCLLYVHSDEQQQQPETTEGHHAHHGLDKNMVQDKE